ncbi:unnamed protein product [Pseudo-nitzschia multistriata]|uniref:Uncharacterized protein n=1 Tax=Pseudo-nitzschia multistriata TaxID=183589 RepID=A0A448Z953_9STRA|nr:unnamed protein product [Pseudo-nitzschia multistriata]
MMYHTKPHFYRQLLLLLVVAAATFSCRISNGLVSSFAPVVSIVPRLLLSSSVSCESGRSICLRARSSSSNDNESDEEDEDKMVSDFFFNISKSNLDSSNKNGRTSMDAGIQEMVSGGTSSDYFYSFDGSTDFPLDDSSGDQAHSENSNSDVVMVVDWECLLDALPYHVELGIHAARTVWPHLNDLCNFDTDRQWLENKLYAMSHVLGCPSDGPPRHEGHRHVACEFALATRLILEEQALDRNESTGKNGKYSRKFHPRSEINGSDKFQEESRSRRPLTAGELAVNWREFIRSTLIVKYSRGPDGKLKKTEPTLELEQAIEEYLTTPSSSESKPSFASKPFLPLFPQTKFALRNSSTKIVIRISHRFDNELVARKLNKQLQLGPHERIAKTYKPENAIRRLFLNEDKNLVLLLSPEHYNDDGNGIGNSKKYDNGSHQNHATEESCLRSIMKFAHQCSNRYQEKGEVEDVTTRTATTITRSPCIVWVDSSWHRLQTLVPVFGDAIPSLKNGKKNTAECTVIAAEDRSPGTGEEDDGDEDRTIAPSSSVWLSLYLAEWPSIDSSTSASETARATILSTTFSENHQAAMVYPWTDCLSWDDAEDILLPADWGLSDTAFQ